MIVLVEPEADAGHHRRHRTPQEQRSLIRLPGI
jgi:hypothetical protein